MYGARKTTKYHHHTPTKKWRVNEQNVSRNSASRRTHVIPHLFNRLGVELMQKHQDMSELQGEMWSVFSYQNKTDTTDWLFVQISHHSNISFMQILAPCQLTTVFKVPMCISILGCSDAVFWHSFSGWQAHFLMCYFVHCSSCQQHFCFCSTVQRCTQSALPVFFLCMEDWATESILPSKMQQKISRLGLCSNLLRVWGNKKLLLL